MAKLEWNTLQEAAAYLAGKADQQWTERSVLDAALKVYKPRPNGEGQPTLIRAAPPIKTRFALYHIDMQPATSAVSPFIRQRNMPWRTIPLYPIHVFELLACGETEISIAGRYGDDPWLKENEYVCIEPQEHPLLVNMAMAGITGGALESIHSAINKMGVRGEIQTHNAEPAIKNMEAIGAIEKQKVAEAFQGIKWDYSHWLKNLASPSVALMGCRVAKGIRGRKTSPSLWDPVKIGLYLLNDGVTLEKLNQAFKKPALKDWADEWKEKTYS